MKTLQRVPAEILCATLALALCACGADSGGDSDGIAAPSVGTTPAIAAALSAADEVDGTADKVVGNCITCSLAMPGKAEHTAHVGDYELHLCSDRCLTKFEADPEAALETVGS